MLNSLHDVLIHQIDMLVSAACLTLIWLVQLVVYPAFKFFAEPDFTKAMAHHQNRISLIVLPLMLVELLTSFLMVSDFSLSWPLARLLLVIVIWLLTFLLFVPLHQALRCGVDHKKIQKLCQLNWLRTVLWSAKFISYFVY